jgi:hypothetical protein
MNSSDLLRQTNSLIELPVAAILLARVSPTGEKQTTENFGVNAKEKT